MQKKNSPKVEEKKIAEKSKKHEDLTSKKKIN